MIPPILAPLIRSDSAGDGHFGASRGGRTHRGVDYICEPQGFLYSPVSGVVTKLGYPYADNLRWRYVEVFDDRKNKHRFFYCRPLVKLNEIIERGQIIGATDDISEKYPDRGMTPHIHYEIIDFKGEYIDPEVFFKYNPSASEVPNGVNQTTV